MEALILQQLAVSLGLGLLVGLERERTERSIAGIRTFPFVSLFGTVCAQISLILGGWIIAAGLVALAAIVIFANHVKLKNGDVDPGMTTEIAMLLLYGVGALIVVGDLLASVVIGGVMAVLLHFKRPLHTFAERIGERDMHAIMQFVVLSLVVLPVLPNEDFGPYEVFNPFKIWLMVVLIVGISLCGYVAYKLLGAQAGTLLGGVIGGLVSSTATTVSYARRSASSPTLAPLAALVIMIAACISIVRVLVEIAAVAPHAFARLAPPIGALLLGCLAISGVLYVLGKKTRTKMPEQKNPAELKAAFIFAGLYALILWAVAAASDHFGNAGLYVVGMLSGLTDVDAITLSTAQTAGTDEESATVAWRTILIAILSNFVFKFATVAALGSRALTLRVGASFAAAIILGGSLLLLWPG